MTKLVDKNGVPIAPTPSQEDNTTWASMVPTLVAAACNAPEPAARAFALGQLVRLGQIVDEHIARPEGA